MNRNKTSKQLLSGILTLALLIGLFSACGGKTASDISKDIPSQASTSEGSTAEESTPEEAKPAEAKPEESGDTILFTDGVGREVEIPAIITRIAPSGPMAQTTLLTLSPEKLVALAGGFAANQGKYFDANVLALPDLGNLYGDTLNMESILVANPQIIIDIGEPKGTIGEDMDRIQDQTGIPTIFIHMEMDNMAEAYRTLGTLLQEEEQAEKIAAYIDTTLSDAKEKSSSIAESDRISVYYGADDGLTTTVAGSIQADVIEYAGAINVAQMESTSRGGGAEVSLEQIMLWDADVAIFVPDTVYSTVGDAPEWAEVRAIADNSFYECPIGPYNWMGRPPSMSRILGIQWLGNLLYPTVFDYDMIAETQAFYSLFYHYDISEDEVKELLANSTYRS